MVTCFHLFFFFYCVFLVLFCFDKVSLNFFLTKYFLFVLVWFFFFDFCFVYLYIFIFICVYCIFIHLCTVCCVQLVKLCIGMIDAGKAYNTANRQFVSGIRELAQQSAKDEVIEVSADDQCNNQSALISPRRPCESVPGVKTSPVCLACCSMMCQLKDCCLFRDHLKACLVCVHTETLATPQHSYSLPVYFPASLKYALCTLHCTMKRYQCMSSYRHLVQVNTSVSQSVSFFTDPSVRSPSSTPNLKCIHYKFLDMFYQYLVFFTLK